MEDTPEKDYDGENNFTAPVEPRQASKRLNFSQNIEIPSIPVRIGFRSVDPRICQLLVDLESKFEIEARRSRQVLAHIANSDLFQQKWEVRDWEEDQNDNNNSKKVVLEEGLDEPGKKRRKRCTNDMTFVLPSRRTIARYVKDSSILNFKHVANQLISGKDDCNTTITFGSDDTKKA